jgi:asparagine synthase (glutamine-hydrolysing)
MCGIAGIVNLADAEVIDEEGIRRMLAMIRHRGPDQFGIYLDRFAGLGNARLSIIDLSSGQQPISNEDGTLWIVFNGEIFNYLELRPELEARGHRFATKCDTEVILHAFEEYGPDCVQRFNGQFALAIWDARNRALFLARDRLGVRPLFYTQVGRTLIFASEIKAILADRRVQAELDPLALDQIFTYWTTLSPRTVFRNIVEVPPGHYLLARNGTTESQHYWKVNFLPAEESASSVSPKAEADCLEEFRELLIDATKIRLRADVPVGAYLSGGIDSSTIAAIIRKFASNRLDTFSIAFSDPQFDESEFQRRMAKFLGTDHQVVFTTHADIGRFFPEVIWHTETPVLRTAPVPMFLLSQLVRDRRYKVVLTGEGADEFLAGYDLFKEAKVRRFCGRQPGSKLRPLLFKRLYPDIAELSTNTSAFLSAFFADEMLNADAPDYSHAIRWRNTRRSRRFFSEDVIAAAEKCSSTGSRAIVYPAEFRRWGPLERGQYLESTIFLSQYLLSSQGDRMGMAHSVEGRFPFLDYRLVEFCNRLPSRLKLRGLEEKYLLKQLGRDWLPPEIWRRRKRPYRAPIHRSFFNDATPEYVRELLSLESIKRAGLFKPAAVAQLVRKIEQGAPVGETDDMALAGILSSQLVHHQFVVDYRTAPPLSQADDVKVCLEQCASKSY